LADFLCSSLLKGEGAEAGRGEPCDLHQLLAGAAEDRAGQVGGLRLRVLQQDRQGTEPAAHSGC